MHRLDRKNEDRDVTLVAENGKEFKAHMHVLSEASPFFENLFNSNMKESIEGVVRLEILTESQMADILEFIYTGSIKTLTQEKAEDLIVVADYLCLESLKSVAQKFLEQKLSSSNCISYYNMAEKYMCEELIAGCRKFISLNFITFAESEDFLNLSSHEVAKWISSDDIVINEEEDVFKILLKWINQEKSQRGVKFAELFRHVRLTCMSRDFLVSDVVTNDLVNENENCRDSVTGALKWVNRASDCHVPRLHRPRKVHEPCVVMACPVLKPLDRSPWAPAFDCYCYLPDKDDWRRLPAMECHEEEPYSPADLRRIQHIVTYRGQLFAIFDDIYKSQCYDPDMNQWHPAPWAKRDPNQVLVEDGQFLEAVLVVKDEICFIFKLFGNYNATPGKLFRYSFDSNSFSLSLNWVERHNSCVVAFDTYIYAIGGHTLHGKTPMRFSIRSEAARFNTVENKWEKIADIQEARSFTCGVAANEKIFIAGGIVLDRKKINTCEMYNIMTDEWQFIASLTVPHSHGNMLLVNETLYVLGGLREDDRYPGGSCASTVECYNHEKDQWNKKTVIPPHEGLKCDYFTFKACSLSVFNGSINNLKVVGASNIEMQNLKQILSKPEH